jgi:hypothetical protein
MMTLIQKIIYYKKQIKLKDRFNKPFPIDANILATKDKKSLKETTNGFDRTLMLKELIKQRANGIYNNTELNFWIINKWGGIKTFKETEKNIKKISVFEKQLKKNKLTKDTFGTISSLSKIPSFIDPDNFVIYDSRVIFTLNWLILTTENLGLKFFPMPTGRNKILVDFDMNTIIHLTHLKQYQNKDELFINYQDAYFTFCNLIKKLSIEIFGPNAKPYLLELLLFTISEKEIFAEIKEMIQVRLKSDNIGKRN